MTDLRPYLIPEQLKPKQREEIRKLLETIHICTGCGREQVAEPDALCERCDPTEAA